MKRSQAIAGLVMLTAIGYSQTVMAQISADGTVGTIVSTGPVFNITGGTRPSNGPNLFHSFSQFSLPTGSSAVFQNDPTVQTIFSRITGGSRSDINGLIKTQGNASLFLMNPNGIMFGPNAKLELGGAFVGTTANSIKFEDGIVFSAGNLTAAPLLSVKVPIGLQMGSNPGAIAVQGNGHRFISNLFVPLDTSVPVQGLTVLLNQILALVGGEIEVSGGGLISPSGHLELGSVADGTVGLNMTAPRWNFNYQTVSNWRDISLYQQAALMVSGVPGGSIGLNGGNINVDQGSAIVAQHFGSQKTGLLTIHARGLLSMGGAGNNGFAHSLITSENFGFTTGNNIQILADRVNLEDGAQIKTLGYGVGQAGHLNINVLGNIRLKGFSSIEPGNASSIASASANPSSGNINLVAQNLEISHGAGLINVSFGTGQTGDLTVNIANGIDILGENELTGAPSIISSSAFNRGDGGTVMIQANQIAVRGGGSIAANTLGIGNSKRLTINATRSIMVDGVGAISGISSRINAAGEVLSPVFQQLFNLPALPTGDSGDLEIATDTLLVQNRGFVGVKNDGFGKSGNLIINANSLQLRNFGKLTATSLTGNGGDIDLQLNNALILRQNSSIDTETFGSGDGGNIQITSPIIVGLENSDIIANAINGKGGIIKIYTQGMLGLKYRDRLTPENDITSSSEFGINGNVQVNTIGINPTTSLNALPVNIVDSSRQIADRCAAAKTGSFVSTGRGGIPQNPIQTRKASRTWNDLRNLDIDRSVPTTAVMTPIAQTPIIEASVLRSNPDGSIDLIAPLPSSIAAKATCALQ